MADSKWDWHFGPIGHFEKFILCPIINLENSRTMTSGWFGFFKCRRGWVRSWGKLDGTESLSLLISLRLEFTSVTRLKRILR